MNLRVKNDGSTFTNAQCWIDVPTLNRFGKRAEQFGVNKAGLLRTLIHMTNAGQLDRQVKEALKRNENSST